VSITVDSGYYVVSGDNVGSVVVSGVVLLLLLNVRTRGTSLLLVLPRISGIWNFN
jgi:hypothetical protein